MRDLIFHYHLFKNAGTSIDKILQENFPGRWMNYDEADADSVVGSARAAQVISGHPDCRAFSSHQAVPPVPEVEGCRIHPIVFLRHPIDRIRSVYMFEAKQGRNDPSISKGAEVAARSTLEEYLRWRLDEQENGVICNFQTIWFLGRQKFHARELAAEDLELAISSMRSFPFVGIVEQFEESVSRWACKLRPIFPGFEAVARAENVNRDRSDVLQDRLSQFEGEVPAELWREIQQRNAADAALYDAALETF